VVECQLPKLDVAGSTPVSRSKKSNGEIRAFHAAGADVLGIGASADTVRLSADAIRRAVPLLAFGIGTINLHQHRVINHSVEGVVHRFQVESVRLRLPRKERRNAQCSAQPVWLSNCFTPDRDGGMFAISVPAAELMPPVQQNALVNKYCAVCHTDAVKNGGLSLEHYDAAQPNPALAAMLLSKLRNGAMGAAGLGIPDTTTRDAWVAATAAQAERAKGWTVIRTEVSESKAPVLTASIVREVVPRKRDTDAPVYRLTLVCNSASHEGEIQLTWSPEPQTNRTFSVSADGNAGIPHRLEGREEKMGNGTAGTSGLAAALLNTPLPQKTLTITDLFPGETLVFPFNDLDQVARGRLAVCLPDGARE
jgi:hypothetical protein